MWRARYGTLLNLSFDGAEFLQVVSVPIYLISAVLTGWSDWALGQLMRPHIEVLEKHELVTKGPYSRIRHPTYTGVIMMALASALLFLHVILVIGFFACLGIAYKKAVLEEELLASADGFGQDYRDYVLRTERFLPKLRRQKPLDSVRREKDGNSIPYSVCAASLSNIQYGLFGVLSHNLDISLLLSLVRPPF